MKTRMLLLSACGVLLAGCINLPQTKALVTPVGVVGIHSFAPPRETPRSVDFDRRVAEQRKSTSEARDPI
jgi:hypothetical protein